jgi:hypothetical protein
VLWGALLGLLAAAPAYAVADFSLAKPGISFTEWASVRFSAAAALVLSVALLPWLFGGSFGAAAWWAHRFLRVEQ